jgi:integrase
MTVSEFVKQVFIPEHVSAKQLAGRTHYRSMLKHVLPPDEVDRLFDTSAVQSHARLQPIPGWPYIGEYQLGDVRPAEAQRLIEAVLAHGYSTQTVLHVRNVLHSLFEHAVRTGRLTGPNPAGLVTLPPVTRRPVHALPLNRLNEVLERMRHPEKSMVLFAILTGMSMKEICSLQWHCVNLTDCWIDVRQEALPPMSIAIRRHRRGGRSGTVSEAFQRRIMRIPEQLVPILRQLSNRPRFTSPDDYVLVSRVGSPFRPSLIAERRLRPIGRDLGMPWLSWRDFYKTRRSLVSQFGKHQLQATFGAGACESSAACA